MSAVDAAPPPTWLLFSIMFIGVCAILALIVILGTLTVTLRYVKERGISGTLTVARTYGIRAFSPDGQERLWHHEKEQQSTARRSLTSAQRSRTKNAVPRVQPQQNAEKPDRSTVQPFTERSETDAQTGDTIAIPAPVPTPDELHKLAHAIVLYARRPNKQAALETAWSCTKGQGDDWQRASALFDAAMGEAATKLAKSKIQPVESVATRRSETPKPSIANS